MAEYIEREAALSLVRPDAPEDEKAAVTIATAKKLVRSIVNRTPAADVAPVVRCKDCLFWERDIGFCHYHSRYYDGGASWDIFNEDDFAATEKGKKMINAKGEVIYTNAEIAYELGIAPATVNAIGKRLFGNGRIPHWTLNDAKLIVEYIKSISVEEDAQRLSILHDAVHEIMGNCKLDAADTRKRVDKDIHLMSKG